MVGHHTLKVVSIAVLMLVNTAIMCANITMAAVNIIFFGIHLVSGVCMGFAYGIHILLKQLLQLERNL